MGTAAEGLPLTINGVPLQDILEGAHVTDLFNCARIDALWEEAVLPILGRKLRFFALVQDRSGDVTDDSKYVEELQSRLAVAKKVSKHPSFAIILCADKHYDSSAIARCFPDDVNVVQMDVQSPVTVQRYGVKGRWDASVCVLVFFGTPGVAFECEWSPYVECGVPASTAALFDTLKRSMPLCGSEEASEKASATSATSWCFFQEGELKHSVVETISLAFNDAAYVVGTACSLDLDSNQFTFGLEADGDTQTAICVQTPVIVLLVAIR
ncbi:hypothetical protein HPB52_012931 [Rhipicephalus sanguineus]|uniref:Uncharacterized protein n=1 Tax=Rhipicephalus sanguineus TaxID=34632 RepID=A0A9D4ST08_RHISA|nr:hypothetical protein HPB52_012931 [Rhipicephalus sanguineus]